MKNIHKNIKESFDKESFSSESEMVSLNEAINKEFFIEQLEERLETDPLVIGGLFDLFTEQVDTIQPACILNIGCREYIVHRK